MLIKILIILKRDKWFNKGLGVDFNIRGKMNVIQAFFKGVEGV